MFAGIYFKLGDLLSLFSLQDDGARSMGRYIMRRPRVFVNHQLRRLNRTIRTAGSNKRSNTAGNTAWEWYHDKQYGRQNSRTSSAPPTNGTAYNASKRIAEDGKAPENASASPFSGISTASKPLGNEVVPQSDGKKPSTSTGHMILSRTPRKGVNAVAKTTAAQPEQKTATPLTHNRPPVTASVPSMKPVQDPTTKTVFPKQEQGRTVRTLPSLNPNKTARRPMEVSHERPATAPQIKSEQTATHLPPNAKSISQKPAVGMHGSKLDTVNRPAIQPTVTGKMDAQMQSTSIPARPMVNQTSQSPKKPDAAKPKPQRAAPDQATATDKNRPSGRSNRASNGGGRK